MRKRNSKWKFLNRFVAMFCFVAIFNPLVAADFSVGNDTVTGPAVDGWPSNLVIDATNTYTNSSGSTQLIQVNKFSFYARQKADPITPFVAKLNASGDYTVLAVGTTRDNSIYEVGGNSFDFFDGVTKEFKIANGETIAIGFLDANADGTGGGVGSVLPYNYSGGSVWYTGGGTGADCGSISEGSAPVEAGYAGTLGNRDYPFFIELSSSIVLSDETDILTFVLGSQMDPATIDNTNHTVGIEVAYGTDLTNLAPLVTTSAGADVDTAGRRDYSSDVKLTVTAEDQSTKQEWTISVSAQPSYVDVTGLSITPDAVEIIKAGTTQLTEIVTPGDATNSKVTWESSDDNIATVDENGLVTGVALGSVTITATSDDDNSITAQATVSVVEKAYVLFDDKANYVGPKFVVDSTMTVNISYSAGPNDTIDDGGFKFYLQHLNVWNQVNAHIAYDSTVANTKVGTATATIDLTGALITDTVLNRGHTYRVWVWAKTTSGAMLEAATGHYSDTINVVNFEDLSADNDILTFEFNEQTGAAGIDKTNHTVEIEVDNGTDLSNLVAKATVSEFASIDTAGVRDYSSDVVLTVMAENGTTQEWTISVTEAPSAETDILTFVLDEQSGAAVIDKDNHTIKVNVASDTDVSALTPTITVSEGATVDPKSGDAVDFNDVVTYTVTAEDQSTIQDWKVTVSVDVSAIDNKMSLVSVYPNPSSGYINVDLSSVSDAVIVSVTNASGAEVFSKGNVSGSILTINDLVSGVYVVKAGSKAFKVVVE